MTITRNDIKLFRSQDNSDNDSGGGAMTGSEVVDGEVNNLFPDISRIDTVNGDVAMRKVFPAVITDTVDTYFGAHAIIRKTPDDVRVSSVLVHTDDYNDIRSEAQQRVEAYLVISYEAIFYLYGAHVAGMQALTFLSDPANDVEPTIGDVYAVIDSDTGKEQYIRVTDVDTNKIVLAYQKNNGDAESKEMSQHIVTITQPLEVDFAGSKFSPLGNISDVSTFHTRVANASKFYGTKELEADFNSGETTMQLDSIYEQLVPSTVSQVPIVNAPAVSDLSMLFAGVDMETFDGVPSVPDLSDTLGMNANVSLTSANGFKQTVDLGVPVRPGSILVGGTIAEDGNGNLFSGTGHTYEGSLEGDIEYVNGIIKIKSSTGGGVTATLTFYFIPASVVSVPAIHTESTPITINNNSLVFVKNISPPPAAGAMVIHYRHAGQWYEIRSTGFTTIGDDPDIGIGSIAYNGDNTATVTVTLGAEPDTGSTIIYSWATHYGYKELSGAVKVSPVMEIDLNTASSEVAKVSLQIDWNDNDSTASGNFLAQWDGFQFQVVSGTGSVVAKFDGSNNKIKIYDIKNADGESSNPRSYIKHNFELLPADGSDYTEQSSIIAPDGGGNVTVPIGAVAAAGNFFIRYDVTCDWRGQPTVMTLVVDQTGNVVPIINGKTYQPSSIFSNTLLSSFTIGATSVTFHPTAGLVASGFINFDGIGYLRVPFTKAEVANLVYSQSSVEWAALKTAGSPLDPLPSTNEITIDTAAGKPNVFLALPNNTVGNFLFVWGFIKYFCKDGLIYTNYNPSTQVGDVAGTFNRLTGVAVLNRWQFTGASHQEDNYSVIQVTSMVIEWNELIVKPLQEISFKTSLSNINASSLQIRAKRIQRSDHSLLDHFGIPHTVDRYNLETPVTLSVDVGTNQIIGDTEISGELDGENGTVTLVAAGEWGIRIDDIVYDGVSETQLPLDAELLGLNPVRLPASGRVPVINKAGTLVVFHEESQAVVPVAGATVSCGRTDVTLMEVVDVDGRRLDYNQFTFDKVAGTLSFNDPLTLEDLGTVVLAAPYSLVNRIEEMFLASEVSITGEVGVTAATSRDFPAGSKVANALVWGDLGARVFSLFHQEVWNTGSPSWENTRDGDDTTAKYDTINYPISIVNRGSVSERWAIRFIGSATIQVIGETLGVVLDNHSVSVNGNHVAPINPATGTPYFTMSQEGFGTGWITNNVVRFNTDGANENMWVIRTTQSGAATETKDSIDLEIRGDAN